MVNLINSSGYRWLGIISDIKAHIAKCYGCTVAGKAERVKGASRVIVK